MGHTYIITIMDHLSPLQAIHLLNTCIINGLQHIVESTTRTMLKLAGKCLNWQKHDRFKLEHKIYILQKKRGKNKGESKNF